MSTTVAPRLTHRVRFQRPPRKHRRLLSDREDPLPAPELPFEQEVREVFLFRKGARPSDWPSRLRRYGMALKPKEHKGPETLLTEE